MSDRPETRRRVTVPDAADALGITVEAVRGRIKRGKLGHVKDGGTVYVLLPIEQTRPDTTSHQPDNDRITDQSKLIEVLESQVEDLRARLDRAEEANRENRRLLAAALERIPAIEPPRDEPQAPQTPPEASEGAEHRSDGVGSQTGAEEPEETARRSWWIRWMGG